MPALIVFLILSFGVSWAIGYGLYAMGGFEGAGASAGLILVAYMFGPAIGALTASLLFDRGRVLEALGFRRLHFWQVARWILYGWAAPLVLLALATAGALLAGGFQMDDPLAKLTTAMSAALEEQGTEPPMPPETLALLTLLIGTPVGILINTVLITFNEEVGWRGWLQPRLAPLGFWPMCLIVGLLWGFWHAPIILMGFNYPGMGWAGVGAMCVFTTLLTPYMAIVRERGGGVWAAGAFHGSLNGAAGLFALALPEPLWPWNGLLGPVGFAVMAAGLIPLALWRRATAPKPEPEPVERAAAA